MQEPISLTAVERQVLANQSRILAVLEPNEREGHETAARIFESGYELEYRNALNIHAEYPESICREVLDILEMHEFLQRSYDNLDDKSGIEEREVAFNGFDGNNESLHLGYANFFCQSEKRFGYLRFVGMSEGIHLIEDQFDKHSGVSLNSHFPVLEVYRRMLEPWRAFKKENSDSFDSRHDRMTKEEMRAILDEATHPSNRPANKA